MPNVMINITEVRSPMIRSLVFAYWFRNGNYPIAHITKKSSGAYRLVLLDGRQPWESGNKLIQSRTNSKLFASRTEANSYVKRFLLWTQFPEEVTGDPNINLDQHFI